MVRRPRDWGPVLAYDMVFALAPGLIFIISVAALALGEEQAVAPCYSAGRDQSPIPARCQRAHPSSVDTARLSDTRRVVVEVLTAFGALCLQCLTTQSGHRFGDVLDAVQTLDASESESPCALCPEDWGVFTIPVEKHRAA